jgi:heptosyltransferase-2
MVAFYSALSGEAGIAADQPRLQVDNAALAADLGGLGLQAGAFSVLAPGSEYGPAKRWPAGHFAELARQLDGPVLLLGSAKEAELCEAIAAEVNAQAPEKCQSLAGKTPLSLALSIIAATKLLVSNDSGLMHVAAALGVRQVALFGSSSPHHTPPLNPKATVLWLKDNPAYSPALDCAPCYERHCPLGHTRCLQDMSPAMVRAHLTPGSRC